MLEKTTRMNVLYDFYSSLLTEKQKEYLELYYREDYSLGEISQLNNVSRQAIYDNIRRTEQIIETYEDKLQLYEKHVQRKQLMNELQTCMGTSLNEEAEQVINKLRKLD